MAHILTPVLFCGSIHKILGDEVARELKNNGIQNVLGDISIGKFSDGEISVHLISDVNELDVFILQPILGTHPESLIELLLIMDAVKRSGAKRIIPIIPYFGYARQDRRDKFGEPISAKLLADLLETAGAQRLITVDLHAGQVEGFFNIPVDNLQGGPVLLEKFQELAIDNCVVVAPDLGSIKTARRFAHELATEIAVVDKERGVADSIVNVNLIGDVRGKNVLLADDMCSTGITLVSAAKACREKGAKRIFAAVTHGLFVGAALQIIEASPIEALLMSNTVPFVSSNMKKNIEHVSIAPLLAEAIARCLLR